MSKVAPEHERAYLSLGWDRSTLKRYIEQILKTCAACSCCTHKIPSQWKHFDEKKTSDISHVITCTCECHKKVELLYRYHPRCKTLLSAEEEEAVLDILEKHMTSEQWQTQWQKDMPLSCGAEAYGWRVTAGYRCMAVVSTVRRAIFACQCVKTARQRWYHRKKVSHYPIDGVF